MYNLLPEWLTNHKLLQMYEELDQMRVELIQILYNTHRELMGRIKELEKNYKLFEEIAPPDVPIKDFVKWCFDAWEEKCEREQLFKSKKDSLDYQRELDKLGYPLLSRNEIKISKNE